MATMLQPLTLSSVRETFTAQAAYLIMYAWSFGMSIWVGFFGGIIALRTLPRHQFGHLQAKSFPVYFGINLVLLINLMVMWKYAHPEISGHLLEPQYAAVAQWYALAFATICHALNLWVIGPKTTELTFARHKFEKAENKTYKDPTISAEFKALNKTFGQWHGYGSLANLFAFLSLLFHGMWIANYGVRNPQFPTK